MEPGDRAVVRWRPLEEATSAQPVGAVPEAVKGVNPEALTKRSIVDVPVERRYGLDGVEVGRVQQINQEDLSPLELGKQLSVEIETTTRDSDFLNPETYGARAGLTKEAESLGYTIERKTIIRKPEGVSGTVDPEVFYQGNDVYIVRKDDAEVGQIMLITGLEDNNGKMMRKLRVSEVPPDWTP
jgi:hypothetical protein